jgi:predicted peptidase
MRILKQLNYMAERKVMKGYRKKLGIAAAMLLFIGALPIQAGAAVTGTKPTYTTVTEVFDWGPAVTKVIVNLGRMLSKGSVGTDTFKVYVVRIDPRPDVKIIQDAQGERVVTKAYVSNQNGSPVDSGNFITLELKYGPDVGLGYPIYYDPYTYRSNSWIQCDYTVTQQKDIASGSKIISGLVINTRAGDTKKLVDDFRIGSFTYNYDAGGQEILTYAGYAPAKDGKKHPLIVWLHGTGEVGKDPTMPILANKSCYFASPETQSCFGGAYVLSPQCSTIWMEEKEGALMALIKSYVSKNTDIDTNRIYIGGNSNGGYMAVLMARDYADYFAAAVPACEAMPDNALSKSDIQKLKEIPIWFTAAMTDTVVPPSKYTVPTYDRLIKAGAKDIHFSYFDRVVDTTGLYKKADGTPFEYDGHFSFIYVFNNQCTDTINGKKITIMQWLAAQEKIKAVSSPATFSSSAADTHNAAFPVLPISILAAFIACGYLFSRALYKMYKKTKRNP